MPDICFTVDGLAELLRGDTTLLPGALRRPPFLHRPESLLLITCLALCNAPGIDVVVSTVGHHPDAIAVQYLFLEAAKLAGVKRFIPSNFGMDLTRIP